MSEDIEPALTVDEWARMEVAAGDGVRYTAYGPRDDVLMWESSYGYISPPRPKALAALLLRKLPDGFTHEDVRECLENADGIAREWGNGSHPAADKLRNLAARIAALLPPPEPPCPTP